MSDDLSQEAFVSRIEAALAQGEVPAARALIDEVRSYYGPQPAFDELGARAGRIELEAQIRPLLDRAQEAIHRALYDDALTVLRRGLQLAPDHPEVRAMLEQTTKAAERHRAAVERNRAVASTTQRIEVLLRDGKWDDARDELRQAGTQFGKHSALVDLQKRLDEVADEAELERTHSKVSHIRALVESKNWRGALQEAERILKRDPKNEEARELQGIAQAELEQEEAGRLQAQEVDQLRQQIDRLIVANELDRARAILAQAYEHHGRLEGLTVLETRIQDAKAAKRANRRQEFAERRLKEAESLVREAGRLSLKGQYEEAVQRLEQARGLDPNHAEIDGMLRAAQTARDKEVFEKKRQEAIAERKVEIEKLLDGLHLDHAERRLRESIAELEDRRAFAALRTRLAQLRDAERVSAELSDVASSLAHGESLDHVAQATARIRQQALAATYSWPQAFLYPFRGLGSLVVLGLYLFMIGAESLPATGWSSFAPYVRVVVAVLAAGFALGIVRSTLNGQNRLSEQALDVRAWLLDLPLLVLIAAATSVPWLAFVLTRGRHQLFAEDRGLLGWVVLAVLVWISAWGLVAACGAVGAFGRGTFWRVIGHLRSLAVDVDVSLAVHVVFVLTLVVVLLRVVPPPIAGLNALFASAVEVWGLVGVPHVIGVVVRRHRLELAKLYG